jgi:hypothetical protein
MDQDRDLYPVGRIEPHKQPRHIGHQVASRKYNCAAMSALDAPAATATAMSRSRSLNPANPRNSRDHHHHRQHFTIRLDRPAYTPVRRQADLPNDTTVPWWGNRALR